MNGQKSKIIIIIIVVVAAKRTFKLSRLTESHRDKPDSRDKKNVHMEQCLYQFMFVINVNHNDNIIFKKKKFFERHNYFYLNIIISLLSSFVFFW